MHELHFNQYVFIMCSLFTELTFKTDMTTFTGGTSSSVTAGLAVLDRTALFKTKPLGKQTTKTEVQCFNNVIKLNEVLKVIFYYKVAQPVMAVEPLLS